MSGVGDYEIEQQIGAGASGTVWKALRRGHITQTVALKRLRADSGQDDLARLRREATVLAELDHPHIVRVLDVLQDGDGLAIAMSLAPGGSLDALLAERGRLSPGELVAVAAPIADALASTHRRGIVHGDVKPANILFTSDGEPLLSDFGVSRTLGKLTSEHITGTATYLAPELLEGALPDARSDIYSLAVVCYEALAGEPPFTGEVPLAVARAADRGDHRSLHTMPGIPWPLADVVERAMARDPNRRFDSAEIFSDALEAAVPRDETRLPGAARASSSDAASPPDGIQLPSAVRSSTTDNAAPPDETHAPDTADSPSNDRATPPDESQAPDTESAGTGGGDSTTDTTTFGPRPPRPPEPAPPGRRRPHLPVAVAAVGVVAVVLTVLVLGPLTSDGSDDTDPDPPRNTDRSATQADCPDPEPPPEEDDVRIVRGDPEGDGCETFGTYRLRGLRNGDDVMILTIDVDGDENLIGLGDPGDQLFLGDWDCDGADTPGLYKPEAGEVQYFNVWPEDPDERYLPDLTEPAPPNGSATVAIPREGDDDGNRCERLGVVAPA